jgi:RNA polymerase sigma-54 factor
MDFDSRNAESENLQDHLLWQLNLTPMSDTDKEIAYSIIEAIDANGMLTIDIESIHAGLDPTLDIELDEVLAVLHRIQQFDPVGVGYRDLSECLLIQLNQFSDSELFADIKNAKTIVKEHLGLLGGRDYAQIMRRTRLKEPELKRAIAIIESLDPRPGSDIAPPTTSYVIPDVIVSKNPETGKWRVELNPEIAPRLRINANYAALVKRADTSDVNTYLRDNLQEARWFLKSLQSRNETLMKVATRIVEHQQDFLEYGEEAMKPLVLHDIAEMVDMHESTISRVTTQKYMHTPRGIFELKYFFSSHVSTAGGGECSSTAIRAIIKKLIAAENARKPLSDSKITQILEEQGINVARRTIAKYRESLAIPPSNERKRLID